MVMELTELSLAPTHCVVVDKSNSSSESEDNPSRKRKFLSDFSLLKTEPAIQTSVDLQIKDPLPLDWERCLDLQSGRMYYFNRKSSKKSWSLPENKQKLDLELNISSSSVSNCTSAADDDESNNKHHLSSASNNMVALACMNCHLLVILSKSSPSCPNCKFVHSLPNQQTQSSSAKVSGTKSMINTLSLLN
ncbi:WW domain-containing protein [Citrus sinensis]|uniref:WW domain-containing protein n=3 Tax=Citrus TaxID=2706 RepID=A0ACB8MEH5_CITSI|nr:uncharacterized protein LOC18049878 [Citrus x clementina]XP_024955175.1 protein CURLY FLAG LEAF 1-like [Citrus sinensis]GAY48895.1 hypothetical protein CUMW_115140 [Citrus unshiu]ESR56370.1 hypothetical protein CICLE_v10023373mg [Citrus x clementina]KAH9727829.1 WW domain-containing protein [Citrus sinensis]KAH9783868.1 WW domain-containing protein [Citrus sinensis]KDO46426.1 hypothetical protein CISIN_1g029636mg [Citrus sinensis]